MMSDSQFRKLLGKQAEHMSDEEVRLLRISLYQWVQLTWARWQSDVMKLDKKP
jgi:hypothetical protein